MTKLRLPYGSGVLHADIPDSYIGVVAQPNDVRLGGEASGLIQHALDHPIASPPLSRLLQPGSKVAVIVDDFTRKTPVAQVLPLVLAQIHAAGVPQTNIRLVTAPGSHRPMTEEEIASKLGRDIASRYTVVNIAGSVDSEMVYLGTSRSGIPAWVNRAVAEADARIGIGMITPHVDAGFTGGAKIILPGVCGIRTVDAFHARAVDIDPNSLGRIESPLRRDLEAFVGEKIPLRFIVNVIVTSEGGIYRCVAGDPVKAHRAGVVFAQEVYGVPFERRFPVVISNAYPYDQDLWQSAKGLSSGDLLTADGGTLILVVAAEEGNSSYPLLPQCIGEDPDTLRNQLSSGTAEDPKAAISGVFFGILKRRVGLILVSGGLSQDDAAKMGIPIYASVEPALERALSSLSLTERKGAVAVLTHGGTTLPLLPECQD
jgi:nickel-dependent lactate racemase